MKKVLITGESGHLGFKIKNKISLDNNYLVVNSDYISKAAHNKSNIPNVFQAHYFNELDITDAKVFECIIKKEKPDILIHTAAYVGTDKCEEDYDGAYKTNVKAVANLIGILNTYCPDCLFVNFSTTATMDPHSYGLMNKIKETTKRGPETWYGQTKLLSEQIIKKGMKRWINLLPVFLFSTYPVDNSSIWAKLFKQSLCEQEFPIYLNPDIYKQYEYSRNILDVIIRIMNNKKAINKDVVITGNEYQKFSYFLDAAEETFMQCSHRKLKYKLYPELDYLGDHVADNSLMLKLANMTESEYNKNRTDFKSAIHEVVRSCL